MLLIEMGDGLASREDDFADADPCPDERSSAEALQLGPVEGAPVIGTLLGLVGNDPLVAFPGQSGSAAIRARSIVDLVPQFIGCKVLLLFERRSPDDPIVVGRLRGDTEVTPVAMVEIGIDGERVTLDARQGLILKCGKASISLSADGKVQICGTDVSSIATHRNRVTGGSVQIN